MIYLVMAVVLGFATWQLIAFAKRARAGKCGGGGCSGRKHDVHQKIKEAVGGPMVLPKAFFVRRQKINLHQAGRHLTYL